MLTLITFVLVFGTIVFFHELGHYIAAKLAGIRVEEFALGFGPSIGNWQGKETLYSLRLFPLGGFVRMAGMDEMLLDDDENDLLDEDDPGSFENKSLPWRLGTIAAGPLMNFVLAIILFVAYFMFVVMPPKSVWLSRVHRLPYRFSSVMWFRPLTEAVHDTDRIIDLIVASPGKEMEFVVKRNGQNVTLAVIPLMRVEKGRLVWQSKLPNPLSLLGQCSGGRYGPGT